MNGFKTLLWLEYCRSRVWAVALWGSLLFWAWGLQQITVTDPSERLAIRATIVGVAALVGAVVLCFMIGRLRSETRRGQYQILLLTPPPGYLHILARFLFAFAVGSIYYVVLGGLMWWVAAQAGMRLGAGSVLQLMLALPFYGVGVTLVPLLAWMLLLMVFISAYRLWGPGWVPGIVMILGSPWILRWYSARLADLAFTLPPWHLFAGAIRLLEGTSLGKEIPAAGTTLVLPQEPLWGMLIFGAVMLVLAGRIWQEVEG